MKLLVAGVLLTGLASNGALAQGIDLTGQYQCIQLCAPGGQPAFITQNGWNMNVVNEAGEASKAWIDWLGHVWVDRWNEGAIYSPDGMTIQFDRGPIWQRVIAQTPPAALPSNALLNVTPTRRGKPAAAPIERAAAAVNAFDGNWSVLILTQSGSCDRAYRYGVRISNGYIASDGGEAVNLQGRVAPNGAVRVGIAAGGQQASGEGRLSRAAGSGTWSGQGSAGSCAGVWQAERRG
jgi:hypothetical protein